MTNIGERVAGWVCGFEVFISIQDSRKKQTGPDVDILAKTIEAPITTKKMLHHPEVVDQSAFCRTNTKALQRVVVALVDNQSVILIRVVEI